MATKNGVKFRQLLVPKSKYGIKCPYAMKAKKMTYHNTDNSMDALSEITYMRNNNNQTSYHLAADENEVIQGIPFDRNSWNAGDGLNGYGNRNTVAVEICRNYDRKRNTTNLLQPQQGWYTKAERNASLFGATVMYEQGMAPILANVKFHHDWSGKWCPSKILNEGRELAFKALAVSDAIKYRAKMEGKPIKPSKPTSGKKSNNTIANEVIAGKWGNDPQRSIKLRNAGYNSNVIRQLVNSKLSGNPKPASKPTSKPSKSTDSRFPAKVRGAVRKKFERAAFTVTVSEGIVVHDAPSTKAPRTGVLKKGDTIHYYAVYQSSGYRWLAYIANSGKVRYVPYRKLGNSKYWGTIK